MKRNSGLWRVAMLLFFVGLGLSVAQSANAGVGAGDFTFSWGQACIMMAVAAAWGDMRREVHDIRKDVDDIKNAKKP
jgi:hypothetical protein